MTTYAYRLRGSLVTDTIAGVTFLASTNVTYQEDQFNLNRHVPTRLNRYVDGVLSNNDLVLPEKRALSLQMSRSGSTGSTISATKTISEADLETVLEATAATVVTIPTDAILGITDPSQKITVAVYQAAAGAVSFAASGTTLRGTAPTAAQYTVQGLMHVGLNEWCYL